MYGHDDGHDAKFGTSSLSSIPVAASPYIGRRRADVTAPATDSRPPYVGRRRATPANEPAPYGLDCLVDAPAPDRRLAPLADPRAADDFHAHATSAPHDVRVPAGRRRAIRPSRTVRLGALVANSPSMPILVGLAATVTSVVGTISTVATDLATTAPTRLSSISALSGSDVDSAVRPESLSRSSDRDAAGRIRKKTVEAQSARRNSALVKLSEQAERRASVLARNRWVLPLGGYRLTARFGEYGLWSSYHTGLDFAVDPGTPLVAMARGVITFAGYDGAYGNKTVLTLKDGTELWYAHQTSIYASVGEEVAPGDVIGSVGSTGNVTGPHLHLEVRPGAGDPVDPMAALLAQGIDP